MSKIIQENCVDYRISKDYTIELKDGTELDFNKWVLDSDIETDNDWNFTDDSKKVYDKLSEEKQDKITDFINEIRL